jgi:hypothetical protein
VNVVKRVIVRIRIYRILGFAGFNCFFINPQLKLGAIQRH